MSIFARVAQRLVVLWVVNQVRQLPDWLLLEELYEKDRTVVRKCIYTDRRMPLFLMNKNG